MTETRYLTPLFHELGDSGSSDQAGTLQHVIQTSSEQLPVQKSRTSLAGYKCKYIEGKRRHYWKV